MKSLLRKIVPRFLIGWYHLSLAFTGAFLYGFPSRKLLVVGVTGTNGKSTTVDLISRILEASGRKTASASSIRFKIGKEEEPNTLKMTMPGRFKLQKFLRKAVSQGCSCAVLEVTSEGIRQSRHRFIDFKAVVFTNLSPEHIESHGGFENYKKAKGELFSVCKKIHVVNLDDQNAGYFWDFPAEKKGGYSIKDLQKYKPFDFKLPGEFNVYNALAALTTGSVLGLDPEICKKALQEVTLIPGRMETVVSSPFKVVVDYAHTPDSLEKVYGTLKKEGSRLICVLGSCGGGRDKWKRPRMGEIAASFCDKIILTDEDPYDESPMEIIEGIEKGISKFSDLKKVLDRRKAIAEALSSARNNDTVVVTGKGSEPWMCIAKGKKIPWSDKEIILEEMKKI
jgi:UDP-N-acetylmuramoyl-L-alanyl-D-glutamate--2,6-diaminopimelate ligase